MVPPFMKVAEFARIQPKPGEFSNKLLLQAMLFFASLFLADTAIGQQEPAISNPYPLEVGNTWTYLSGKQKIEVTVEAIEKLPLNKDQEKAVMVELARLQIKGAGQPVSEHVGKMN